MEPGGVIIEPDDGDEGFVESSSSSLLSTVPSEVKRLNEEHGRLWTTFGKNPYYLPVDDDELDRLDLNHYKYTMVLNDQLFLAPIAEHPQNILDLGTGTGIWAIEVADKYPSATVIGTDIAPIQPAWVPPNCTFQIDDAEEDWTFHDNTFDFVHNRAYSCCANPRTTRRESVLQSHNICDRCFSDPEGESGSCYLSTQEAGTPMQAFHNDSTIPRRSRRFLLSFYSSVC